MVLAGGLPVLADDGKTTGDDALFGPLPVVEAAALHAQTLQEAPANVTLITAADIRRYGYRTLNDALSAVRGFFSSYDRIYHYMGVRGFSLPGDYNTRFLVMLNGHPLTDQVYNANSYFGQDLGIDMDLVERIEIIRGPSSALYGSNGILATINIVTRSPVDAAPLRLSTEADSLGEKKAIATGSFYLGAGANLLASASIFYNGSTTLDFPGGVRVNGIDGETGYHTFANLVWHNWSFTAYFTGRTKQPPVPWGEGAVMFQRGDYVRDSRNFAEADYTASAGPGKLRLQFYYDQYRYDDRFYYPLDDGSLLDQRSIARGDSLGTRATWQAEVPHLGELSAGAEFGGDLRNLQQDHTASPQVTWLPAISHPDLAGAAFLQQQWKIVPALTLYAGLRYDRSYLYGGDFSPRLAAVWQQSDKTTFKLVYGQPYRKPSAFENYYTDGGLAFLANGHLRPETGESVEASVERKLISGLTLIVNGYDYLLRNIIEANYLADGVSICENTGTARSRGVEFELDGHAGDRLEAGGSYSFQTAVRNSQTPDNLPSHLAKFRAATPLARRRLWLGTSFQYMSARETFSNTRVRPVALADFTLTTERLHPSFDVQVGVRNLAGWRYSDPVALGLDQMPADGRSIFVKLIYHSRQ